VSNWKREYHGKQAFPDWGDRRARCPICDEHVARRLDGTLVAHMYGSSWCSASNTDPEAWYGPDE
jgi:hypothetical protein